MSKIRVLPDHISNLIAAGEVVERPASVAKELVENAIDAGATRIVIDVESGGRRLLKITDDGEGMTRDDAILAFERHATSKISKAEDLAAIGTLGFRGEALASIASVARVELITCTEDDSAATRVTIEGGRMRDVKDAAHPRGTTISVRDLFFNTPARRKFLRSEATESYHLTNLVTHYALAHPEISLTLTNNGRETLRVAPAKDLRERAYQIFGAQFLEGLVEVNNAVSEPTETSFSLPQIAKVQGFVSAPRERRTSRDAQFLFVNGRFVRDRLIGRALSEGYRSILPHGVYPIALLFIDVPLEEVDVNVHPAKTEVRFRRAAAIADAVRESVRAALASAGYARGIEAVYETVTPTRNIAQSTEWSDEQSFDAREEASELKEIGEGGAGSFNETHISDITRELIPPTRQGMIEFGFTPPAQEESLQQDWKQSPSVKADTAKGLDAILRHAQSSSHETIADDATAAPFRQEATEQSEPVINEERSSPQPERSESTLPPLVSA